MPLDPVTMRRIAQLIRDHHDAYSAALLGPDQVSPETWQLAIDLGLVRPGMMSDDMMKMLHAYGATLAHIDDVGARAAAEGWTQDEWLAYVDRNPFPFTQAEKEAATWSAARAGNYITGLGNKIGAEIGNDLIEADQDLADRLRGTIRDAITERFTPGTELARETVRKVASQIGHRTQDWTRDLARVALTETQHAVNEGLKQSWEAQEEAKGEDAAPILVFKLPRPDCCEACAAMYLDGDLPKVFTLSHLSGNGTNVRKKRAAWLPVVGPLHPYCGCTLHRVPALVVDRVPATWSSGQSIPTLIGPGGKLLL